MSTVSKEERSRLLEAAQRVASRAYAPYSKLRVGAAVLTEKGSIYTGCNVENASYGLSICAERAAILSAVAHEGGDEMRIKAVAVISEKPVPCPPCGACRQVIHEFGPHAVVLYRRRDGLKESTSSGILPNGFTSE